MTGVPAKRKPLKGKPAAATTGKLVKLKVQKVAARTKSAGRPSVATSSGRGVTNGFADALRNYAGSYKTEEVTPPEPAKIARRAGSGGSRAGGNRLIPQRDPRTRELLFEDDAEFRPNLTPSEVILLGSFGGTYFRDIYSAVTRRVHKGVLEFKKLPWKDWGWEDGQPVKRKLPAGVAVATKLQHLQGTDWARGSATFTHAEFLTSPVYSTSHNRFGVKCGGSLDMWESSGWINESDPYGWFQWYCWYYLGRRTSDDARQISRWKGLASAKSGRFRRRLMGECKTKRKHPTDATVSPVIRQTLQHWGVEIRG